MKKLYSKIRGKQENFGENFKIILKRAVFYFEKNRKKINRIFFISKMDLRIQENKLFVNWERHLFVNWERNLKNLESLRIKKKVFLKFAKNKVI